MMNEARMYEGRRRTDRQTITVHPTQSGLGSPLGVVASCTSLVDSWLVSGLGACAPLPF